MSPRRTVPPMLRLRSPLTTTPLEWRQQFGSLDEAVEQTDLRSGLIHLRQCDAGAHPILFAQRTIVGELSLLPFRDAVQSFEAQVAVIELREFLLSSTTSPARADALRMKPSYGATTAR